jgi:alkylhydroperoxidase/carboxymuconolactone decarboxylase family protein YurZ
VSDAVDADRLGRATRTFQEHMGSEWVQPVDAHDPPELAEFKAINLARTYGDSWSRDGLDRRTKILVTLAMLATQRAEAQLATHLRAAEHSGVSRAEVAELLIHVGAYAGASAASSACAVAQTVWRELDRPRA